MNIGTLLRKHRKEAGLTLRVVAESASISEGFLSQVENDVNSPSVETLMRICRALKIDPGELLSKANSKEDHIIIRKSDWQDVEIPHSGFATRRFFPPEDRRTIDSAILVLEPGKTIPARKNIKNGQEVVSVLKGTATLDLGEKTYSLSAGDSVHFRSKPNKQKITNTAKQLSYILWIGTL